MDKMTKKSEASSGTRVLYTSTEGANSRNLMIKDSQDPSLPSEDYSSQRAISMLPKLTYGLTEKGSSGRAKNEQSNVIAESKSNTGMPINVRTSLQSLRYKQENARSSATNKFFVHRGQKKGDDQRSSSRTLVIEN